MAHRFCEHLQDYGSLFAQAEAAYHYCNELVDSILADGLADGNGDALSAAVAAWVLADKVLRDSLVELARAGRVQVPRKKQHAIKRHGTIRCSQCGFKILKLKYADWEVAANGLVQYHGDELPTQEAVPSN